MHNFIKALIAPLFLLISLNSTAFSWSDLENISNVLNVGGALQGGLEYVESELDTSSSKLSNNERDVLLNTIDRSTKQNNAYKALAEGNKYYYQFLTDYDNAVKWYLIANSLLDNIANKQLYQIKNKIGGVKYNRLVLKAIGHKK
ncbi:MAG: hypothetical protein HOL95_05140 [Candidatus Thioglobus sp.]|jgi:hypothetical protein|nr:hypothetical protein [Candidatus Thioglobus sp.]